MPIYLLVSLIVSSSFSLSLSLQVESQNPDISSLQVYCQCRLVLIVKYTITLQCSETMSFNYYSEWMKLPRKWMPRNTCTTQNADRLTSSDRLTSVRMHFNYTTVDDGAIGYYYPLQKKTHKNSSSGWTWVHWQTSSFLRKSLKCLGTLHMRLSEKLVAYSPHLMTPTWFVVCLKSVVNQWSIFYMQI